ncbi:MAG: chain-length determining protein [Muribaculaceae bacterium]|nr:chain-length determining protein [Muribaculaceae bacterium]
MEDNKDIITPDSSEQEIDLLELARKLWDNRKTILKWGGIGIIAGLVIALSIPKEYTTTIKLAPEASQSGGSAGNLGALAAMAGISPVGNSGKDAVNPQLYPDIVNSIPFTLELFNVSVTNADGSVTKSVKDYVSKDLSAPWWSAVMSLPGKAIGGVRSLFSSSDKEGEESRKPDSFRLTPEENGIVGALAGRVSVDVDGKTSIISISVTMQDPVVSAMLADTVAERLKEYVTDYRTNKARSDLSYAQKLNDEAREDYFTAQQNYASYMDKNQGVILRSMRNEEERLQNEMQLAFNLYNTTAQQLQMAKAKVQEITPVYTIVQPATVPLAPSKPSKMMIIVGCLFLAVVAASAWVLFGRDLITAFKNKDSVSEEKEEADTK